jgi:ATP-binding cassette subfamily B protein
MNLDAVISTITAIATAGALAGGGYLVTRGQLSLSTLVLLLFYVGIVQQPMSVLATSRMDISRSLAAMERVFEVLEFEPGGRRPSLLEELAPIPRVEQGIDFANVSFRYPEASRVILPSLGNRAEPGDDAGFALADIDFTVPRGSIVALVGATGSGKSTIAALAAGLYRPDGGHLLIDGVPINGAPDMPRPSVAFVTQDAHLFHDTIRENLRFAKPDATDAELVEALRAAQILTLVESLPKGLDTVVGDRGYRLSGGERQRLAIARLLLKGPDVMVLDEATAHLDSESEAAVQLALKTALAGRTSIVIAHRLSTVREADQILVIAAGRIVERGTHGSLLAAGGLYADLYRTQFQPQASAVAADGSGLDLGELESVATPV